MEVRAKISHTSALILQTLGSGYEYGFDLMDATGLPSGTIYPALRRLERDSLILGTWEEKRSAFSQDRQQIQAVGRVLRISFRSGGRQQCRQPVHGDHHLFAHRLRGVVGLGRSG